MFDWRLIELDPTPHDFVVTATGNVVHMPIPHPGEIAIEDIANQLCAVQRFSGALLVPCSVAAHCLNVSRLLPPHLKLVGLLHDAAEAYMGDLASVIKHRLPDYCEAEAGLMAAIFKELGVPDKALSDPLLKQADMLEMAWEQSVLLPAVWEWAPLLSPTASAVLEDEYGFSADATPEEYIDRYVGLKGEQDG